MLEALVTAGIAALTGMSVLTSKLHSRISELDKRIDKPSCVPKVHIFIDEAMHKHEATHDGFAVCHYRSIAVACRIRIWCAHVTLSIMCICVP